MYKKFQKNPIKFEAKNKKIINKGDYIFKKAELILKNLKGYEGSGGNNVLCGSVSRLRMYNDTVRKDSSRALRH